MVTIVLKPKSAWALMFFGIAVSMGAISITIGNPDRQALGTSLLTLGLVIAVIGSHGIDEVRDA